MGTFDAFLGRKTFADFDREAQEFEARKRQRQMQDQLRQMELQKLHGQQQFAQSLGQDPNQDIEALLTQQAQMTGDASGLVNYQTQKNLLDMKNKAEIEALRQRQNVTGGGVSAYMKDAQRLMEFSPELDPMEAYALARGGVGQGTYFNPQTGGVDVLPGFAQARGNISQSEAAGSKFGAAQGQAIADLPRIRASAQEAIISIDRALQDPALKEITGWLSTVPITPGGERARAEAVMNQLGGLAFLAAYEQLKGAGTITEIEGQKAEAAISTIGRSQSYEDVVRGITDLRGVITRGVQAKEKAAGQTQEEILQDTFTPGQVPGQIESTGLPSNSQEIDETIFNAKKAIKAGAPRDVVIQRLIEMGIDPVKAGI